MDRVEIARTLSLSTQAPGAARRLLDRLPPVVPTPMLDRIRLVVSELVTNAVKHSGLEKGAPIDVRIAATPRAVRLEVRDQGRGFTPDLPDADASPSGWGLHLVEKIADRWGVLANDHTIAWAEFDLAQSA
jgi:anti-sigma regulatory factor (Ser/Thr protein kinase)